MKILVAGDVHWSSYSSILRSRGERYSTRLEYLIRSLNWVEDMAALKKCDAVVFLGDFFDRAELNSEEITALKEVHFRDKLQHYFLVGNHEAGKASLSISTAHLFNLSSNITVCDRPIIREDEHDNTLAFLPYILESDRLPLTEYLPPVSTNLIIFSHNDIKGMQMGKFVSKEGFSITEIESGCRLFINGHLHNGTTVGRNIINLGNLSGQNFSEDADIYRHNVLLLDTSNFSVEWYENPYALNFYKLDFTGCSDVDINYIRDRVASLTNAVCTVKVNDRVKAVVEHVLDNNPQVIERRLIVEHSTRPLETVSVNKLSGDHVQQFVEFVKEHVAACQEFDEELLYITAGAK